MTHPALLWARNAGVKQASRKHVLLVLATYADPHGTCFPSISALCEATALNRKTVIEALSDLVSGGWIEDTSTRVGRTKQVKVYRLRIEQSQNRNGSKSGTVPLLRGNSPKNGTRNSTGNCTIERGRLAPPVKGRFMSGPGRKPKDLQEAIARGQMIGLDESDVKDWYRDAEACEWHRGDGTPYDNWVRQMCIYRDTLAADRFKARQIGGKTGSSRTPNMLDLKTAITLKEERARQLKEQYASVGPLTTDWSNDSKRDEYRTLIREIKELKARAERLV